MQIRKELFECRAEVYISGMHFRLQSLALIFLTVSSSAWASDKFSGDISDVSCGNRRSAMGNKDPNHAVCAMKCVQKGEKYALVLQDGLVLALVPGKLTTDEVYSHIEDAIRKGASKLEVRGTRRGNDLTVDEIVPINEHSKS
jgi:hypothetical protein